MATLLLDPRAQSPEPLPDFDAVVARHGLGPLIRQPVRTLQVNVGKLCNQACHHCHVEAGPARTETMSAEVADRVLELLARSPGVETLDLTGGAPELNPNFRRLVVEARRLGRQVIDRCNLTILLEPGMEQLSEFMAAQQVRIVASLPCYQAKNVDKQRGRGVFDKSIDAMRRLNRLGYGTPGSPLEIDLVYNPGGAYLPPPQDQLEAQYREELGRLFGLRFNRLLTITNMPIKRFADFLDRVGQSQAYMCLLANHFNPATVGGLMCRSLLNIGWDGRMYDCDFNQMLEIPTPARTIWEIHSLSALTGRQISTGRHCFGCTAGAGSSCTGALQ
ncbi:MAG: arsenosugar biosynthesis radical SAM protein ArsS [Acidobacteria bacterium]|nr:arsenosugar biosynthesis radical SAM protein ArsS [Acidobacteriota bacterium]